MTLAHSARRPAAPRPGVPASRARGPLPRLAALLGAAVLLMAGCTDPAPGGDPAGAGDSAAAGASDSGGAGAENPAPADLPPLVETGTSAAMGLDTDPAEDPAYAAYYDQTIQWGQCEDVEAQDVECGTITVPLRWDDPAAGDIEIAVGRLAATGERTGSLVTNPGGPGGSGVNFLESAPYLFSTEVRAAYDIVGFDPRGVNRSEGIECLGPAETDEFRALTLDPEDPEAEEISQEWMQRLVEGCERGSGDVLPYVDTFSAARDMDVLRAALGSEKLDYLGFSYGTYLGATYAELQPERVGRFVLDGAMDPSLSMDQIVAGQAKGFEVGIERFLADCLAQGGSCPFKGEVEEAQQQLIAFFDAVDAAPLDAGAGSRELTGGLARAAVFAVLYQDALWPMGRDALTAAMNGDGSQLLQLADLAAERRADGTYRTNALFAQTAVNCLDHPWVASEQWHEQENERLQESYPVVGGSFIGAGCEGWPNQPVRTPAPITAEGAAPIVVIGTTYDPATPYVWAQSLAEQLDSGVLLTFEGDGHTAYGRSGGCIEAEVNTYLLEGTVPQDGLTC